MKVALGAVLALLIAVTRTVDACDHDFRPPLIPDEFIRTNYAGAILRLQCCGPNEVSGLKPGTGFLVDSEHGFVLTAAHVVTSSSGTAADIHARSSRKPAGRYRLRVLKRDVGPDVALLQLDPPDALKDVRPVDIATYVPNSGMHYTMSYPREEDAIGNLELRSQGAEVKGRYKSKFIDVKRDSFVGDSGSPLFDSKGKVIGMATDMAAGSTLYRAVAELIDPISVLAFTKRMETFDSKMRQNTISEEELVQDLMPSVDTVTNVELLTWTQRVAKSPSSYSAASSKFPCPVLHALQQRELPDAVIRLASYANDLVVGRAMLAVGERFVSLDEPEQASEYLAAAEPKLALAIETLQLSERVEVNANLDRARALLRLGEVTSSEATTARASEVALEAVLNSTDEKQKGLALTMLGDAQLRLQNPKTAARAYALAYQLGYEKPWVVENWEAALNAAGITLKGDAVAEIEKARVLTNTDLNKLKLQ